MLRQDQETRLKRVFRIGRMLQDLPANPHDHGPVPLHQQSEGRFVLVVNESPQQSPIGGLAFRRAGNPLPNGLVYTS